MPVGMMLTEKTVETNGGRFAISDGKSIFAILVAGAVGGDPADFMRAVG